MTIQKYGWNEVANEKIITTLNTNLDILYSKYNLNPYKNLIFRAFEICPEKELKVVVLGQDPYTTYHADGIAFSSCIGWETPPSLQIIYNAILESVYNNNVDDFWQCTDFSVKYKKQGILWLNRGLSTLISKSGDENIKKIYEPFIFSLVKYIVKNYPDVYWLILTKKSSDIYEYINKKGIPCMLLNHPSYALRNNVKWEYEDCFNKINNYLKSINKPQIIW